MAISKKAKRMRAFYVQWPLFVRKCSDVLSYFRNDLKKIFLASRNPQRRLVPLFVYSVGVGGSKQNAGLLLKPISDAFHMEALVLYGRFFSII